MDDLPAELIAYIFTSFPDAGILSSAMLTCRKWYKHGARILHSKVVLNLRPGLTVGSPDTVVSFMKRLISPTLPTADYIHHLTISGFASPDIQELILNILSHTRALRSLNVCSLQLLQDSDVLIAPQVLPSTEFLPSLTALNATSATLSVSLAHTRRLRVMRVHEPMGEEQLRHLFRPGSPFAVQVQLLELALSVESTASAIASLTDLVSALAEAQLDGLALQFVSNRPGPPVSWKKFEHTIEEMGKVLQRLPRLRSLSLVLRPDPIIPANADGVGASESGEKYREKVTELLAEKLIRDYGLTRLERIELRWHGWMVENGQLAALPRGQLLRLPHQWLFESAPPGRL